MSATSPASSSNRLERSATFAVNFPVCWLQLVQRLPVRWLGLRGDGERFLQLVMTPIPCADRRAPATQCVRAGFDFVAGDAWKRNLMFVSADARCRYFEPAS